MADTESPDLEAAVEEASKFWNEAVAASEGKPIEPEQEPEAGKQEPEPEGEADSDGEAGDEAADEATDGEDEAGEPEPEQEDDPWASVPEELRKAHEEALKKAEKYEHEARSNRGRLASLEKKHRELSQKLESEPKTPAKDEKKESAADPVDSIFDFPEWKKFEADFGTDVAEPNKAAFRRMYEAMHSRLQTIEEQAKSLQQSRSEQKFSEEYGKFHQDFNQLIEGYDDDPESGEPGYLRYARDNFTDLESFAASDEDYQKWWSENFNYLTKPKDLMKLITAFEASRGKRRKADNSAPPAKSNGADHKPEPPSLTPKRKQQLKSAGTPPPRSAPGPGSRSKGDLPDPENFSEAFKFFESRPTR